MTGQTKKPETALRKAGKPRAAVDPDTQATLYAKLVYALVHEGPMSFMQLADYTGLAVCTVRRYCHALENATKPLVRVCEWDDDPRGCASIGLRKFTITAQRNESRPRKNKLEAAAQRRADKRLRSQTSVFNMNVPRYVRDSSEGERNDRPNQRVQSGSRKTQGRQAPVDIRD